MIDALVIPRQQVIQRLLKRLMLAFSQEVNLEVISFKEIFEASS